MKTYIGSKNTFTEFDFTSKFYAGLNTGIVVNIQPILNSVQPKHVIMLMPRRANGGYWSPVINDPFISIEEFKSYIDKFPSLEIFEFDSAKEKFTWMADRL